ncbi:hypothetical protein F4604DRAFT_1615143, partial [Suillus subluteus]
EIYLPKEIITSYLRQGYLDGIKKLTSLLIPFFSSNPQIPTTSLFSSSDFFFLSSTLLFYCAVGSGKFLIILL